MRISRQFISILIVLLLAAMIVGFNVSMIYIYDSAQQSLDRSLGDRLLSIARTLAPEVEPEVENELFLGELSLATATRLNDYFRDIRDSNDLSGVYLLDLKGEDLLSLDDSTSGIELYLPLYGLSLTQAQLGDPTVSDLYQSEQRYFKSAFYPLGFDSVVAVLVVESAFGFFDDFSSFRRTMLLVNLIAVAFLLVVGIVILMLNRKLVRAEQLLVSQAALTQMGQMAAIIAHEVRNPLAIIKAAAERVRKKQGGDAQPELEFIPEEVDRLNEITSRYLQFAAPPTAEAEMESVAAIATSVVDGLKCEFSRNGVDLKVTLSEEADKLRVNSAALRQILLNLLRNALEVSASGGKVTLLVDAAQSDGQVRVSVSDQGRGMDRKELARVFDPFYTTKTKGTGLGLFVVRRLIEQLGGEIEVNSETGRGSIFTVKVRGSADG